MRLVNLMAVIISHCIHILNRHIVHLLKSLVVQPNFFLISPEQMLSEEESMMHHLPSQPARAAESLLIGEDPIHLSPGLPVANKNQGLVF